MNFYKDRRAEAIYEQILSILVDLIRNASNYSDVLEREVEMLADIIRAKEPRKYPKRGKEGK